MISAGMCDGVRNPSVAVRILAPRFRRRRAACPVSQSAAAPRPALLSTLRDSSAHFMRVAEMSIPSSSRMNVRSRRSRSSTFMPLTSSEAIDAEAWLIAQPWPLKRTSSHGAVVADAQHHAQLVAAERVGVLELEVGLVHLAPVVGALVVLEDLLAVQVVHQAKTSFTRPRPATSRSTSSRGVVHGERRARGRLQAERAHQRLGAVVAGADADAVAGRGSRRRRGGARRRA